MYSLVPKNKPAARVLYEIRVCVRRVTVIAARVRVLRSRAVWCPREGLPKCSTAVGRESDEKDTRKYEYIKTENALTPLLSRARRKKTTSLTLSASCRDARITYGFRSGRIRV